MVEASTVFLKAGYDEEQSAKLAQVATLYQNIADEEISASEAGEFIVAQMKAFNMTANESEQIIDAVNEVSNNFAVSSADLANNIGKISAVMSTAGNSYEELLGMTTAITEQTRNASTAVRGLRQISTRLMQVMDESSSTGKKLTQIYKDLDIALYDQDGQLRSTYDILYDLSEQWDSLDTNTKDYIALTSAGSNQIQNFTALMNQFDTAVEATDTALNSSGSASRENERYMESLEAKVNQLKAQFQEFVLGDGGLSDFIKKLVDTGTAILKFANTDLGGLITKVLLVIGAFTAFNAVIKATMGLNLASTIAGWIANIVSLIATEGIATVASEGLLAALIALDTPKGAITAIIALIGALAFAVYKVVDALVVTQEEAEKTLDETIGDLEESKRKVADLQGQIEDIDKQINEMKDKELSLTDETELALLQSEKIELEGQLKAEQAITEEKEKQAALDAQKTLGSRTTYSTFNTESGLGQHVETGTVEEQWDSQRKQLLELRVELRNTAKSVKEYEDTVASGKQVNDGQTKAYEDNKNKLIQLNNAFETIRTELNDNYDAYVNITKAEKDLNGSYHQKLKLTNELIDANSEIIDSNGNIISSISDEDSALDDLNDELEETEEEIDLVAQASDKLKDSLSSVSELSDAYKGLQDAVAEYNEQGYLSQDTLEKLLELDDQYLAMLDTENGQLSINAQEFESLRTQKLQEAQASIIASAQAQIEALARQENAESANIEKDAINESSTAANNSIDSLNAAGKAALRSGQDALAGAQGWSAFRSILSGDAFTKGVDTEKYQDEMNKIIDNAQKQLTLVTDLSNGMTNYTGSVRKAGSSASSSAKKTNEFTDALKALKKAMKAIADYVIDQMGDAIDGLEKKIDSLEDEFKKLTNAIGNAQSALTSTFSSIDTGAKTVDKIANATTKWEKKINKVISQVNNLIIAQYNLDKAYNSAINYSEAIIDRQNDLIDYYDEQIDLLEAQKDAINERYDAELEGLEKTNDELDKQIKYEQLLDDLNKAKNKKIQTYQEGKGFQYTQNVEAISSAQQALQEYSREKQYEERKAQIEQLRKEALAQYEEQISYYKNQKQNAERVIAEQQKIQKQLQRQHEAQSQQLAEQAQILYDKLNSYNKKITNTFEKKISKLQTKLEATKTVLEKYKKETNDNFSTLTKQEKEYGDKIVAELQNVASKIASSGSSSGSSEKDKSDSEDSGGVKAGGFYTYSKGTLYYEVNSDGTISGAKHTKSDAEHTFAVSSVNDYGDGVLWAEGKFHDGRTVRIKVSDLNKQDKGKLYASGTYSVQEDEIAVVGDDPQFSELVVGSKINAGAKMISATQGTGIIPHNLTSTLVSMAQAWQSLPNVQTNNTTNATNIKIEHISLPNVENGEQFVDYLQNFNTDMSTLAFAR